jgi:hypothetical protein
MKLKARGLTEEGLRLHYRWGIIFSFGNVENTYGKTKKFYSVAIWVHFGTTLPY